LASILLNLLVPAIKLLLVTFSSSSVYPVSGIEYPTRWIIAFNSEPPNGDAIRIAIKVITAKQAIRPDTASIGDDPARDRVNGSGDDALIYELFGLTEEEIKIVEWN